MPKRLFLRLGLVSAVGLAALGCGAPATTSNVNTANGNFANASNLNTNSANSNTSATTYQFAEPNSYQGVMRLTFETMGQQPQSKNTLPPIVAMVARNGADRMMEFTLPTNEKVQYVERLRQLDEIAIRLEVSRAATAVQVYHVRRAHDRRDHHTATAD